MKAYRMDRQVAINRVAKAVNSRADDTYEAAALAFLQRAGWDGERFSASPNPYALEMKEGNFSNELAKFSIAAAVNTEHLLGALLAAQLGVALDGLVKDWLDRLVQRFEVTKKLYASYPPGFRKGEGANTSVRLYWLLALSLCLFYAQTRNLKYLNVLLKVNDLLISLPPESLIGHISTKIMTAVFRAELAAVAGLAVASKG